MDASKPLLLAPPASLEERERRKREEEEKSCRSRWMRRANVRGSLEKVIERQIFDLVLVVLFYFGTGTVVLYWAEKDFNVTYAFFYAINVGLGVGYGNLRVTNVATKFFLIFYMLFGSSVVISTMKLFVNAQLTQTSRQSSLSKLRVAFLVYSLLVAFGVVDAYLFQHIDNLVDAFVFAVGNYTTAGLIVPRHRFDSLFFTTISLLIGVPCNLLFLGNLAHLVIKHVYETSSEEDDPDLFDDDDVDSSNVLVLSKKRKHPVSHARRRLSAYQQYLEDQLLKAGVHSPGRLAEIRSSFLTSDANNQDDDDSGDDDDKV